MILALGLGCPARSGHVLAETGAWIRGEAVDKGSCTFLLEESFLRHEEHWRAGLGITMHNPTESATHCAWDMAIIDPKGDLISGVGRASGNLGPGSDRNDYVEIDERFTAQADPHGTTRGTWISVRVHEGYLPGAGDTYHVIEP